MRSILTKPLPKVGAKTYLMKFTLKGTHQHLKRATQGFI